MRVKSPLFCNTQIYIRRKNVESEGWDADDDYYKDYEHPVGWNDDFVCMTIFYWGWTGGQGPAHEYHNDYKPNIARHRLKIGLTGFPGWFASAQAEMRWNH